MQWNASFFYISRALPKTEIQYAQIGKETISILFACERLHTYFFGRRFKIINDHKPLVSIFNKPITSAPKRLQRMMLRSQNYQFILEHRPGTSKEMIVADTLSRAYPEKNPYVSESEQFFGRFGRASQPM